MSPRIGLMIAGGGGLRLADLAQLGVEAEAAGFAGVHLAEAWRSGLVPLTAIAARTSRITIAPYVLNAHARTPLITGLSAVDLDELSGGRLLLGVGSGNRVTNESYQGVRVERPLRKMREYVELLRVVVGARAGTVHSYDGQVHSMRGWVSQVDPVRPTIPIYLAATSPRMTRVAAEVADGLALGTMQSAGFVAEVVAGARAVAGDRPFGVLMAAFLAVDDDREAARDAARRAVVNLYAGKPHPHYDSLLRQQGYAAVADALGRLVDRGDVEAAVRAVPDDVVDALTIAGAPAECERRLAEYGGAVDEVILANVGGMRYQSRPGSAADGRAALFASYRPVFDLGARVAAQV